MKAERGQVVSRGAPVRERRDEEPEDEHEDTGVDDELVMVLFPKVSYDAFQELARKHGASTAEVVSHALKLLEQTLAEKEKS